MNSMVMERPWSGWQSLTLSWMTAGCLIIGCGEEKKGGEGTPPSISELSCTPAEIAVGTAANVSCTFSFTDPDGDLATVSVTLKAQGQSQSLGNVAVANAAGKTAGQANVIIQVAAGIETEAQLTLFAIDENGNESNDLIAMVSFVSPP